MNKKKLFELQQAFTQNLQNNKGRGKKLGFRSDYDFEEANKAFETLCLKGDNPKVGEEAEQVFYDFFQFYFAAFHFNIEYLIYTPSGIFCEV